VQKLMQLHGIKARSKRKYKATTDSNHSLPVAENSAGALDMGKKNSAAAMRDAIEKMFAPAFAASLAALMKATSHGQQQMAMRIKMSGTPASSSLP
jgi:hypothetical protein